MPRRTKILATLGPATDDPSVLSGMIAAGLDVVRLNFSHGQAEEMRRRVSVVREIAAQQGRYIGVLADLQGPKIRIASFRDGPVDLVSGHDFCIDTALGEHDGDKHCVGCAYDTLHTDVAVGNRLLLNDGLISLLVKAIDGTRIKTEIEIGGTLSDHKGINLQGGGLSAPALTDKDRDDIKLAANLNVDYLAVSFVQQADDVNEARRLLREAGGSGMIVAKIERSDAVENIDAIVAATDVIMVARGDLGVEVGYAELTGLQKRLIRRTRRANKIVITATQMMESMIHSAIPTRAEVSDVANAVIDGTDAVMLSAETAVGDHPVKVIHAMSSVCVGAEKFHSDHRRTNHRLDDMFELIDEAIATAVMYTANHMDVKAIIALTESGSTPLWMSRIRSDIPIFAFTRHEATRRRVTLYRGVYPVSFDITHADSSLLYTEVFQRLLDLDHVEEGDLVIFSKGDMKGITGGTNAMKILRVAREV
ncbi:MAG: pyruvate kinase [Pseudomonadota bacterium]